MSRPCVVVVAGPRVIGGISCHAGSDRIEFDVAVAGEQIAVSVGQRGFEATFPQCAGASVARVEATDIAAAYRLHHA